MNGHVVCLEAVAQIACVCKADAGSCDEVVLHLNDSRLFALKEERICDLTARKSAADNDHTLSNRLVSKQEINSLDGSISALDGYSLCHGTRSNDYLVGIKRLDVGYLCVHLYVDRVFSELADVPRDKRSVLLLEAGSSSRYKYATELVSLFIKRYCMSALSAKYCGFHTAYTAADNSNFFRLLSRLYTVLLRLHRLGIERAARKTHSVGEILRVRMSLGGREVKAARVTADTGLDVLYSVLDKLCYPLGIGKELSCNSNAVYSALGNRLRAHLGIHSTRADHGNIDKFLNMSYVLKVAVLRHIHRGMRPIPRVVGSVVRVEHIVARVLKILCRALGLFHITSDLNVILTGHSALAESLHLGLYGITNGYGEVLAARLFYSLYDLSRKAISVLKAAAVLVGALVEELDSKLVKKISLVNRVNLNAVNARITTELCGLCEGFDDLVDLLLCHLRTLNVVRPTGRLRRGGCKLVACVKHGLYERSCEFIFMKGSDELGDSPGASHTRGELNEQLCSRLMYLVHKGLQLLKHLGILPEPLAPEGVAQRRDTGDNKTYVVVGAFKEKLCGFLVKVRTAKLKPTEQRRAAHRAHNDTVLDLNVSDLPRCK